MPIQLFYFPLRGRAQAIRYMCVDNNIDYEEINVRENWPTAWKPKMPFGQAPVIKDGDVEVAQSCAILRYLGRKKGLDPTDPVKAARVDMINDHQEDIRNLYVKMIYQNYEAGKEDFVKDAVTKVTYIENLMKSTGTDFITDKITFADYNLFDLLDILTILSAGFVDQFPTLKAFYDRIASRPAIKKYRESEQNQNWKINGNGKQ